MPNSIVKSFAEKTGKSISEVEAEWDEAKETVNKKISETDEKFYPTVVALLKKKLQINEEVAGTVSTDIATIPKRLGEKPLKQASMEPDGKYGDIPYFNVHVNDYLKVSGQKKLNQPITFSNLNVYIYVNVYLLTDT